MITADTITGEDIRELREMSGNAPWIVTDTFIAETVGKSDMFWQPITPEENREARARCAELINRIRGPK